ncbi:MAG: major capsid protein [Oscillospiraceae bacterium]
MANIYELVTAKPTALRWVEKFNERKPFIGEAFFPATKQLGLDLSYIKGGSGSPKLLNLSAFDAKAIPLDREGFEALKSNMPFFKNSKIVDERDRQELNKVMGSGNKTLIEVIVNKIFDDNTSLLANADITREAMRMQALTTGQLAFSNNGVSVAFDYGVPAANKITLTQTKKWSAVATADPIADITAWQDQIENTVGVRPTVLLMNSVTFGLMKKCDSVKNAIYVLGQGKVTPSTTALESYVMDETGCTIKIVSKGYSTNGTFTKFVPDNKVILLPAGPIGKTVFGTTPEESDLMSGTNAEVSIVDTGVAITTSKETDPVNVITKVSMICMPSLEAANEIIQAVIA